jgi:transposase
MDERMRFVIRLKDGESMTSLCREFGISRKTGYKILERFEHCGVEGLSDRARRPHRYANQLPAPVEAAIVAAKHEKPHWGARKIYELLLRRLPSQVKAPARSTIMPFWIDTVWWQGPAGPGHVPREHRSLLV